MTWDLAIFAVLLAVALAYWCRAWREYRAACRRTDQALTALRQCTTACYNGHLGPPERCAEAEGHPGSCAP